MRIRAFAVVASICVAVAVPAAGEDREISLDRGPDLQALGVRISGFFVGSYNYNSRIQLVPEFAGGAPLSSEPTHTDFRFDQFSIGAFKTFSPWLSAGASIEVERTGLRHSNGFDPDLGCPAGTGSCVEQFGAEPIETEVSLHRFNVTAVAPVGNGLSLSVGRFDAPFGYERHDAALNVTATTSELQRFGRPQSMTGFLAGYSFTPWLDAVAWFVNRWENETTEDPLEDNNAAKSVGGRIGITPIHGAELLTFGVGGFWGPEQDGNDSNARWIVDADVTWSPSSRLFFAGEFLYGGESGVSFRARGLPFPAPAADNADVNWLALYAVAHYDVVPWLGLSFRYGFFDDYDGARTGVAQRLHSFTFTPMIHLSRLIPDLRPLGVAYSRTRTPIDWVDLRLEYRVSFSDQPVFSDAPPGVPITQAGNSAHVFAAQVVVNY
jgi:hypothetical protein